ncbi:MAG: hypothetical protein HQL11_05340, partial [Candidatus Omnitrophica bacterium]|nr:hypothetical protein [Candidatus Omnitrophota bacterium]
MKRNFENGPRKQGLQIASMRVFGEYLAAWLDVYGNSRTLPDEAMQIINEVIPGCMLS